MEKPRRAKTIRFAEQDKQAIAAIREYYGLSSDNETIRFALRRVLREMQAEQQGLKAQNKPA
jgi:Arc/MetJ family transcription regulator